MMTILGAGIRQCLIRLSEARYGFLVGSCIEESDVKRFPKFSFWQEDSIGVCLGVVAILGITGKSSQEKHVGRVLFHLLMEQYKTSLDSPVSGR